MPSWGAYNALPDSSAGLKKAASLHKGKEGTEGKKRGGKGNGLKTEKRTKG